MTKISINVSMLFIWLLIQASIINAIHLNISDPTSIKSAASTIAYGLQKWYTGNVTNTPATIAVLPKPYYWWEGGAMWGSMLDYYHNTNDSTYNAVTTQALLSQVGPNFDYMVPLRTKEEGNDDQAFWGFTTMRAAEIAYPEPVLSNASIPYTWANLTANLWNTQVARWDNTSCAGGLKWQIFTYNAGYDYKNSVSNGGFFQLSARLARFTGNTTYAAWANRTWDWSVTIGLISDDYDIYDGTNDLQNCSSIDQLQWTYSAGIYLYGAAIMYNISTTAAEQTLWASRINNLISRTRSVFTGYGNTDNATDILYEQACEPISSCNYDQYSFKTYLARYMWATMSVATFSRAALLPILQASALAAAQSCSGNSTQSFANTLKSGTTCGSRWWWSGYDGVEGPGQQMAALETVVGLLGNGSSAPLTSVQVPQPIVAVPAASTVAVAATSATSANAKASAVSGATAQRVAGFWGMLGLGLVGGLLVSWGVF